MADDKALLNQLFDEAASFKFEEQNVNVDMSVPRNLSEQEINAVTMVTKFDDQDFIGGVRDLRTGSVKNPWTFFWVNKGWYNTPGNSMEFGKLFPGALVVSFSVRGDRRPFSYVMPASIEKLQELSEVHYLVLPIKTIRTVPRRSRLRCEYLGAGFYTHGNYSLNDFLRLRDVILFGKPAAMATRHQAPTVGSYNGYIPPRMLQRYVEALVSVKELINRQYDAAV